MGSNSWASGLYSVAIGDGSSASGDHSTAMSSGTATGSNSTAMGEATFAEGSHSMAMGFRADAIGDYTTAIGSWASTNGQAGSFVYGDNSTTSYVENTAPNQFLVRAAGGFRFRTSSDLSTGCNLPAGSGSWDCTSSRLLKTDFAPLDGEAVLTRVRELPVELWSYRAEPGVRHLGTFAEDFHRAFGLGPDATSIGSIDMDGVNLAAVKALEQRTRNLQEQVNAKDQEITGLNRQLAGLDQQLTDLRQRLERLETAQH